MNSNDSHIPSLAQIGQPVAQHLTRFEPYFREQLQSPNTLLALVTNYALRSKGKQMRPLLVFLAAQAAGGVSDASYAAATLIELLHNASLVHDDVVDETYTRRGQWSVTGLWNSKIAVLVGDFFLSRGMDVAIAGGHVDILRIVSKAVGDLAQGELSQIEHARKLDLTEESYYEVIRKKTATLIEACTRAGATSVGASPEVVEALASYGANLGVAFQIRDDIFDYSQAGIIGKPTLNDIKEQKFTLPLIYALSKASDSQRSSLMRMVRVHPKADDTANEALALVSEHGGIDYAVERMGHFASLAKKSLVLLPQSEARQSLSDLVDFNTKRKK